MLQPTVRRTWAPRGRTPIQPSWDRHDRLSVISAVTLSPRRRKPGLVFEVHRRNIRTEQVVDFLKAIHRKLGNRFIVVLDRYSVHRGAIKRLREAGADWLEVEWLPPYAPDLNPDEQVWNHCKYADLPNFIPDDLDHLEQELLDSLVSQSRNPGLLRSYFAEAKLRL
jgi:transposase